MDVKKVMMDQLLKLLQDPRVMRLAMNPRVMGLVMRAMSVRGQMASATSAAAQSLAKSFNLATREEVRELRRTIRRLEEQVSRLEFERDEDASRDVDDEA